MAVTRASSTGQVVFTRRFGVYMVSLTSDRGELYQQYTGNAANPEEIMPNYTQSANQPTLSLSVVSSRTAEQVGIDSVVWKVDDVNIGWSGNLSATPAAYAGCFQKVNDTHIKIVKNLVTVTGGSSLTLKAVAQVSSNGVEDSVQATYNIPISLMQGGWRNVNIVSADNKYMTIRERGGSCKLRCEVYNGTAASYKWYKLVNGAWSLISGATARELTVNESDIETSGMFKCEAYNSSAQLIGSDQCTVLDMSDPLYIVINPKKRIGSAGAQTEIYDDLSIADTEDPDTQIVFNPELWSRDTGAKVSGNPTWTYVYTDYAGNILNTSAPTQNYISKAMCEQAGDVSFYITGSM